MLLVEPEGTYGSNPPGDNLRPRSVKPRDSDCPDLAIVEVHDAFERVQRWLPDVIGVEGALWLARHIQHLDLNIVRLDRPVDTPTSRFRKRSVVGSATRWRIVS